MLIYISFYTYAKFWNWPKDYKDKYIGPFQSVHKDYMKHFNS